MAPYALRPSCLLAPFPGSFFPGVRAMLVGGSPGADAAALSWDLGARSAAAGGGGGSACEEAPLVPAGTPLARLLSEARARATAACALR
jgi:hypothetical protein